MTLVSGRHVIFAHCGSYLHAQHVYPFRTSRSRHRRTVAYLDTRAGACHTDCVAALLELLSSKQAPNALITVIHLTVDVQRVPGICTLRSTTVMMMTCLSRPRGVHGGGVPVGRPVRRQHLPAAAPHGLLRRLEPPGAPPHRACRPQHARGASGPSFPWPLHRSCRHHACLQSSALQLHLCKGSSRAGLHGNDSH